MAGEPPDFTISLQQRMRGFNGWPHKPFEASCSCRDAFLSCDCQSRTGYSGTATYVRTDVALPFAAEEGFTGCSGMGGIVSKAAGEYCGS
jgi:hypothetical protein